jgi:hypothetical protein
MARKRTDQVSSSGWATGLPAYSWCLDYTRPKTRPAACWRNSLQPRSRAITPCRQLASLLFLAQPTHSPERAWMEPAGLRRAGECHAVAESSERATGQSGSMSSSPPDRTLRPPSFAHREWLQNSRRTPKDCRGCSWCHPCPPRRADSFLNPHWECSPFKAAHGPLACWVGWSNFETGGLAFTRDALASDQAARPIGDPRPNLPTLRAECRGVMATVSSCPSVAIGLTEPRAAAVAWTPDPPAWQRPRGEASLYPGTALARSFREVPP